MSILQNTFLFTNFWLVLLILGIGLFIIAYANYKNKLAKKFVYFLFFVFISAPLQFQLSYHLQIAFQFNHAGTEVKESQPDFAEAGFKVLHSIWTLLRR